MICHLPRPRTEQRPRERYIFGRGGIELEERLVFTKDGLETAFEPLTARPVNSVQDDHDLTYSPTATNDFRTSETKK